MIAQSTVRLHKIVKQHQSHKTGSTNDIKSPRLRDCHESQSQSSQAPNVWVRNYLAGTRRLYSVALTSMQRHDDINATLYKRHVPAGIIRCCLTLGHWKDVNEDRVSDNNLYEIELFEHCFVLQRSRTGFSVVLHENIRYIWLTFIERCKR